jgi:hypothetical protein
MGLRDSSAFHNFSLLILDKRGRMLAFDRFLKDAQGSLQGMTRATARLSRLFNFAHLQCLFSALLTQLLPLVLPDLTTLEGWMQMPRLTCKRMIETAIRCNCDHYVSFQSPKTSARQRLSLPPHTPLKALGMD